MSSSQKRELENSIVKETYYIMFHPLWKEALLAKGSNHSLAETFIWLYSNEGKLLK
jgi:hypothetical protein